MQLELQPINAGETLARRLLIPCFESFFDETGESPALVPGAQEVLRHYTEKGYNCIAIANTGHRDLLFEELVLYFQGALKYVPWIGEVVFSVGKSLCWVTYKQASAYIEYNVPSGDRPSYGAIWLAKHVLCPRYPDRTFVIGSTQADSVAAERGWCDYSEFYYQKERLTREFS